MAIAVRQFVLGAAGSATASGDVANVGGYLKFDLADSNITAIVPTNLENFPVSISNISGGLYQAGAAEVLRIIVVTPTAANSTDYRITLSAEKGQAFNNNLPNEIQTVFSHTTPVSGGTRLTIVNAFVSAINNHPYWTTRVVATQTGSGGSETLTITARAGFPIFSVGVGQLMTQAVTQAGSPAIGIGASLLASGLFPTTDDGNGLPVSGQTYNVISYDYEVESKAAMGHSVKEKHIWYINNASNNNTLLGLLQGFLVYR